MRYEVIFPSVSADSLADRQMVVDRLRELSDIVARSGFVAQVLVAGKPGPRAYATFDASEEFEKGTL